MSSRITTAHIVVSPYPTTISAIRDLSPMQPFWRVSLNSGGYNMDRIVAETPSDRPRARSQSIPAGGYPRICPDARFLNNEIVIAEAVDRSGVGRIDRAVARDHLITVGDDLQQPARPDNGAVGNFDDIGDMLLRFLAVCRVMATA